MHKKLGLTLHDIKNMVPERRLFYIGMLEEISRLEKEQNDKISEMTRGLKKR